MKIPGKFRSQLLQTACSVAVLATAVSAGNVYAQEQQEEENLLELEEIVITGTRIKKNPMDFAAPVMGVDADDVKYSGNPDLGQFLQELPALGGGSGRVSFSDSDQNGNEGLSFANLRGLGANRTLVLVNGKRHVGGGPNSLAVDLSTIPTALIKRVEVLTGGASAVYGSDAVTGVLNFVLDDEFEGVQIDANKSARMEGSEGSSYQFSLTAGTAFADDKGHITFSGSRDSTKLLQAKDQPFRNSIAQQDVEGAVAGDGLPDRRIVSDVYYDILSPNGMLNAFGSAADAFGGTLMTFNNEGTALVPMAQGRDGFVYGGLTNAHNGRPFGTFSFEDFLTVIPESQRTVLNTSIKYDLNDNAELYADIKYVETDVMDISQPEQLVFTPINVADNPYLPEDARQALTAAGYESVPIIKSLNQLNKSERVERESLRFVGGIEGTFDGAFADVDYDFYYVFGRSDNKIRQFGERIDANRNLAVDAVEENGEVICRFNASPAVQGAGYDPVAASRGTLNPTSCAPLNPFGLATASPEALAFISAEATFTDRIEQEIVGFNFVSDSSKFLNLPAGPIDFAGGFEYREETLSRDADELSVQGVITSNVSTQDFPSAGYDVTEVFFEMSVPLLSGLPGIDSLTLDAAVRAADYSHSGRNTAWKWGANWGITPDLRIRGTVSQAVRAPNISEAFAPTTRGTGTVLDHCDADRLALEPAGSPVAANCAALGVPTGFNSFEGLQIDILSGGNADLEPETSDSYTVGFVYAPEYLDGLTLEVDYWNIEIDDAIDSVSAQTILDTCLRNPAGNGSDPTCGAITRNDGSDTRSQVGNVTGIVSGPVNIASLEAAGWDLNLTYDTELFNKPFRTKVIYSRLIKNTNFPFQNDPTSADPRKGELNYPDQKLVLSADYDFGPVAVRWEGRYIASQILYDRPFETEEAIAPRETGSIFYNDLFVSAPVPGYEDSSVYLGVNNIFDEDDVTFRDMFLDGVGQYDQLGRTIVAGFSFRM